MPTTSADLGERVQVLLEVGRTQVGGRDDAGELRPVGCQPGDPPRLVERLRAGTQSACTKTTGPVAPRDSRRGGTGGSSEPARLEPGIVEPVRGSHRWTCVSTAVIRRPLWSAAR